MGVDAEGNKHVLGLQHAATENAAAAEDLLTGLVERGVSPAKKRLFVLDGSKALRAAVHKIFGDAPVRRCRAHKLRNVLDRLPKAEQDQAKAAIRAAWRLEAKDRAAQEAGRMVRGRLARGGGEFAPRGVHEDACPVVASLSGDDQHRRPNAGVRRRTRRARMLRWCAVGRLLHSLIP